MTVNMLVKVVSGEIVGLVQGITGREGSFHTGLMLKYGTKIAAGVTPGKGGHVVHGIPVYDSVEEALDKHPEVNASVVFVPASHAYDATLEAIEAGLDLIVVVTEGIPVHLTLRMVNYAKLRGCQVIGPNTPGLICPSSRVKLGIMPARFFWRGKVVLLSRSGTLTYEVARELSRHGIGVLMAMGVGGDPVVGTTFVEAMKGLEELNFEALILIGEIGGRAEEEVADYVAERGLEGKVVAYIAGRTAPEGKRMGHAGAVAYGGRGRYEDKVKAFREVGVKVVSRPSEIPLALKRLL